MYNVNPLVSIIIPTYNRGEYLKQCLNSILNQTYSNYEVIICDDGSTDNTTSIVNKYTSRLNLRYDFEINTGGPASPRNRGIKLAKGEFIAFLDSDDYWHSNKLKFSIDAFKNNVDVIYHDLQIYPASNIFYKKKIKALQPANEIFPALMTKGNFIPLSSAVIRKNILYNTIYFDESNDMVSIEDYDFWIRLSLIGVKFNKINSCLGYYNVDGYKLTKSNNRVDYYKYLSIFNKYKSKLSHKDYLCANYFTNYNLGRISYLNNNFNLSQKHLLFILKFFKMNMITAKSFIMIILIQVKKYYK
jgi:glycosyltransferase involved in cell wall biosynthesis